MQPIYFFFYKFHKMNFTNFTQKSRFLLFLPLLTLNFACGEDTEAAAERTLDKQGSVEVTLATAHLDSLQDVLTTVTTIYAKGATVRTITRHDTIPSLGKTAQEAENENGDTQTVTVPKDYEIFVTLK